MKPLPRLREIMARDLILFRPDMDVLHAMEMLLKHRISGACVVDQSGALVGVLSKKDYLRAALHAAYHQDMGSAVAGYMSTAVETLDPGLDLVAVAERFLSSNYRRFPVLEDGRLIGQVSRADVLKALTESW